MKTLLELCTAILLWVFGPVIVMAVIMLPFVYLRDKKKRTELEFDKLNHVYFTALAVIGVSFIVFIDFPWSERWIRQILFCAGGIGITTAHINYICRQDHPQVRLQAMRHDGCILLALFALFCLVHSLGKNADNGDLDNDDKEEETVESGH